MPDEFYVVQHLLNIIVTICLIYLAFTNMTLCLALLPFQMFTALWLWKGIRDEVQDGNKQ
jgi:hypothetical protein